MQLLAAAAAAGAAVTAVVAWSRGAKVVSIVGVATEEDISIDAVLDYHDFKT